MPRCHMNVYGLYGCKVPAQLLTGANYFAVVINQVQDLNCQYRHAEMNVIGGEYIMGHVTLYWWQILELNTLVASFSSQYNALLLGFQQMKSHYSDVTVSTMASQIIGVSIVCSTVGPGADQRKHQCSASLAFVRGIHRWPVNSPHKRPVTR